ncbi:porin [Gracilimonas mengyeensis]|uniref:Phosphate-selective porin O and P n=1 Tax=Gracilimonas mengyeensis TaxID=1302730 RepID=A0A521CGU0_9BACT|nr:hypothetical protein [Gracilimonas mengyeensis]SMO58638.1 Phosphate-selective porin O and P [Gracilimonas mengyeensis]
MYILRILFLLFVFLVPEMVSAQATESAKITLSPEKGFYVESADGFMGFKISTRLQQQFGFTVPMDYSDAVQPNFLMRRARIRIHGYFYDKKLTYFVQTQMDKGNFTLSNAEFRWKATDNLQLNFGQLWPVGGRQFRTVSEAFQMIDRSPVSRSYWPGYDIGMIAQYNLEIGKKSLVKSYLSITHGEGMNKPSAEGGMAYGGRLEWLPFGTFAEGGDYRESDLYHEETPKLSLGGAVYYNQDAYVQIGGQGPNNLWKGQEDDISALYLDGVFKFNGLSILAEYADRKVDQEIIEQVVGDFFVQSYSLVVGGSGFSVQGGKFISPKTEPTLRVSLLNPHDNLQAAKAQFTQQNTYTLGLNHFLRGHHLKLQFELNLLNEEYAAAKDKMYLQVLTQFSISF